MKSVMKHQFNMIPRANIPRSSFNRSHGHKTTFNGGWIVPIYVDEALPGDTFNLRMTGFARLATPIHPIMDNLFMETFFFAVPYRLVWNNWQKFNGEQDNPGDSTDYLIPQITSPVGGWLARSLEDHMGLPTALASGQTITHSCLWHRAYNLIYNEWFRDENLQPSLVVPRGDGPDLPSNYAMMRRGKRHDYFTSALPWPQKGPGVELPIVMGGEVPVVASPNPLTVAAQIRHYTTGNVITGSLGANNVGLFTGASGSSSTYSYLDPNGTMKVDLGSATFSSITVEVLRQSVQVQKIFERDARGGTRYTEIIRSHFGVVSPDARLQRPEYLGGGSTPVNIHSVPQTSNTTSTSPQGNLAAFGVTGFGGHGFTKSFTEHCLLLGFVNVRADLTYQQGLNRMFSRRTRFDHYLPALSHLGEQAILNKEIYAQGLPVDNDVFGYQEHWSEYRYKPSQITGLFRSVHPQSLDVWHLSQDFANLPTLSSQFIEDNPPIARVIAVPSEPQFIFDSYFSIQCARPMPVYSVPGLMDHF